MYNTFFKQLAKKENGKFYFSDENIAFLDGVRSPNITYKVTFHYKDNCFTIINRTGTAYVGSITCNLSKVLQPIAFEINNISHFKNLFFRRRSRLKISSDNSNISYFILNNEYYKRLEQLAHRDKFDPIITCKPEDTWDIVTNYHLEFENWTEPIEPIINLYKDLIDEFEKRIANLSPKSYKEMKRRTI